MLSFDRRFLDNFKKLGLEALLYQRYVDAITIECPAIKKGWSYNQEKEAIAILGVLHENSQLFDPFQQKSGILSLQNSIGQGLVAWHISIEEVLMCSQKKVEGEIYHKLNTQDIIY